MELSLVINQNTSQISQLADQFGIQPEETLVRMPEELGDGYVKKLSFPGGLEVNHYCLVLREPLVVRSSIPKDAETFLVNINLNRNESDLSVDGETLPLKKVPQGIFFYSPGIEAFGKSPIGIPFDIVTLTFPKAYLDHYLKDQLDGDGFTRFLANSPKFCVFEDLDPGMETLLRDVISETPPGMCAQFATHIQLKRFMLALFNKVGRRREGSAGLHPEDLQKLFMISGILKDHLRGTPPSIDMLAREAGMSASKLKRGFKQVFGIPPYQYYLKAKMKEARTLLQSRHYAISEVGHLLGYSNLSKFSQAFKKEFGMTPRQYRGTIGS